MKTLEVLAKLWLAGHLLDKCLSIIVNLVLLALAGVGFWIVATEIRKVFGL